MLTITSQRNFGYPFPPTDGSQGAVPCHSSNFSKWFSLEIPLIGNCFFRFFFEVLGFLSDSFSKILSPYFLTMFNKNSSIGMVTQHDDFWIVLPADGITWATSEQVVAWTIAKASQNCVLKTLSHISCFPKRSFNPRFASGLDKSVVLRTKSPAVKNSTKYDDQEILCIHPQCMDGEQRLMQQMHEEECKLLNEVASLLELHMSQIII